MPPQPRAKVKVGDKMLFWRNGQSVDDPPGDATVTALLPDGCVAADILDEHGHPIKDPPAAILVVHPKQRQTVRVRDLSESVVIFDHLTPAPPAPADPS